MLFLRLFPSLVVLLASLRCLAADAPTSAEVHTAPSFDAVTVASAEVRLRARFAQQPVGGLSVGISVGKGTQRREWTGAFGFANLGRKAPASVQTSYRMASITKTFTAVAIMQLVQAGKIDLDAPIQEVLPHFPKKHWPLTARQLLGHLGGIPHYRGLPGEKTITRHVSTSEALAIFQDWDLVAQPGTKYVYSTYGFNVLGAMIERASGQSYGAYLHDHLFAPLHMGQSRMDDPHARIPHRAKGYRVVGGKLRPSRFVDVSSRFAGGGTRSTVADLLRYGRALLANTLVTEATTEVMQTSQATADGRLTDYGLGFAVYPKAGRPVVAHAGNQPETSTLLMLLPSDHVVIALGCNTEDQWPLLRDVAKILITEFVDHGQERRQVLAEDADNSLLSAGLYKMFSHGLAWYSQHHAPPPPTNSSVLEHAFAHFDQIFTQLLVNGAAPSSSVREQVERFIDDGYSPVAQRALTRIGTHMAATLASVWGAERLQRYPVAGPLPFVVDYLDACRIADCPKAFTLSETLQKRIRALGHDWQRSNALAVRQLHLTPESDLEAVSTTRHTAFDEAKVVPDLGAEFASAGRSFLSHGGIATVLNQKRATAFFELGAALMPHSLSLLLAQGDAFATMGQYEKAQTAFTQAFVLPGAAKKMTASRLKYTAFLQRKAGRKEAAFQLLSIFSSLLPQDVLLLDALAKAQQDAGLFADAITSLKRAQEIAPSPKRQRRLLRVQARVLHP